MNRSEAGRDTGHHVSLQATDQGGRVTLRTRPIHRFGNVLWLASLLLVTQGCGDANRPKLVPVTGKVIVGSQPATAGSIIFHPDAGNEFQKDRPSSLLQLDGSFTIKTFPYGEGVPPGKYKVTLSPDLAGRIQHPKLGDAANTPWTIEVPITGIDGHIFEVK